MRARKGKDVLVKPSRVWVWLVEILARLGLLSWARLYPQSEVITIGGRRDNVPYSAYKRLQAPTAAYNVLQATTLAP